MVFLLASIISHKMLSIPKDGLFNKMQYGFLYLLRRALLHFIDPVISNKVGKFELAMPFSHNLPYYVRTYPHYSSNIGRLANYISEKYTTLSVIDIGANIGDSVALIKTYVDCPILCIEGNDFYFNLCKRNMELFSNVSLEKVYIGDKTEFAKLEIRNGGGTSHIYRSADADAPCGNEIKSLAEVLKSHPAFLSSKLLKIDTDGFDCIIIRGAYEQLSKSRPIIFFEYDPFFLSKQKDDGKSVFSLLHSIGYKALMFYDNFGIYFLSAFLDDCTLLEDLHNYITNRGGKFYYDICVFHSDDMDLFRTIRAAEIVYFIKNFK